MSSLAYSSTHTQFTRDAGFFHASAHVHFSCCVFARLGLCDCHSGNTTCTGAVQSNGHSTECPTPHRTRATATFRLQHARIDTASAASTKYLARSSHFFYASDPACATQSLCSRSVSRRSPISFSTTRSQRHSNGTLARCHASQYCFASVQRHPGNCSLARCRSE